MKIVITNTQVPFIRGGAEALADNLKQELIRRGHEAELVTLPFSDNPTWRMKEQMASALCYPLNESWAGRIDLCIGLRFPAWFMPHDNKVIWAMHQYRGAYDLFDTPYSGLKDDAPGRELKEMITKNDTRYLSEARRLYTISPVVSERMEKYNGLSSTPLYHPCPGIENYYAGDYGDYILMPSRISSTKRQLAAVEAMTMTKTPIKLVLIGRPDTAEDKEKLESLIRGRGLESRVTWLSFVSEEEKLKLYANARGVLFVPVDEDYGYITLEAMAAARPVITAVDSGGPLAFVEDDVTGEVIDASPAEIARAMDYLYLSDHAAKTLGCAGKMRLSEMNITWDHVVDELTRV